MPLNSFVTLGHSGLRVSRLVMGGMTFGEEGGFGSDAAQAGQILSQYLELGGNFIDTPIFIPKAILKRSLAIILSSKRENETGS